MRTENNLRQNVRNNRITGVLIIALLLIIGAVHMPRNRTAYAGELPPAEDVIVNEQLPVVTPMPLANYRFSFDTWRIRQDLPDYTGAVTLLSVSASNAEYKNLFTITLPEMTFGNYTLNSYGFTSVDPLSGFHFKMLTPILPIEPNPAEDVDGAVLGWHWSIRVSLSIGTIDINDDNGQILDCFGFESFPEVELPEAPPIPHYTFVGWFLDEELTIPYTGGEVTEGLSLYPKYTINRYVITYVTNCATALPVATQEALTKIALPALELTGHVLTWYTDAAFAEAYNFDSELICDITLYAKWTVKVYTVTLYNADKTVFMILHVPHGTPLKEALAKAQKELRFAVSENVNVEEAVEDDIDIDVQMKLGALARAGNAIDIHFQNNWKWWVVGGSVALVLIALIFILSKKHGGKK